MSKKPGSDIRTVLWVCAGMVVFIAVAAFFAPAREDNDPTPSTWNSGAAGAKAAYLMLGQVGYAASRWDQPAAALNGTDAQRTTLILADPYLENPEKERAGIADFLRRGGRVVATGAASILMLPHASIGEPEHAYTSLCYTTPESLSPMGRAGQIAMPVPISWTQRNATVDQACGDDAVVVHYLEGAGEVVWWSSSAPLSNHGLRDDPDLRLLLASVGDKGRTVLFDEYIHGARTGLWDTTKGTPVTALCWQLAAIAVLLVLSFSRRSGPVRALARSSRTSPLEFAESMGALYEKAGAAEVATSAAEHRLMGFLHNEGGIPRETLRSAPETIAEAVGERFFYKSPDLALDVQTAREAELRRMSAKGALELVRRIDGHIARLMAIMTDSHAAARTGETRD